MRWRSCWRVIPSTPCSCEVEVLRRGRAQYANDPYGLIAASHVVALEFATLAAANDYCR